MLECKVCNNIKKIEEFQKDSSRLFGYKTTCKTCLNIKRRAKPKREILEITLKEFKCVGCKETKDTVNFDRDKRNIRGFVPYCKACRSKKNKVRYLIDPEKKKLKSREYYKKSDPEIRNSSKRKRRKEREAVDLNYKLRRRLRNRLYYALKKKEWKKTTHFSEYIGCTREYLINHLQIQFKDGMTWDNYGKWEIDHIIPLSIANTPEELYKLCHYTNLQPLWKAENAAKSNKIDFSFYSVKEIEAKDTYQFIKNNHYLKRIPSISYSYGLFCREELVGIVTFGIPSSKNIKHRLASNDNEILELNRLFLKYNRKNEASFFVSRTLKLLPVNTFVLSFADEGQDHFGYVYQATNFKYYGLTEKRIEWASYSKPNLHSRTVFDLMKQDPTNSDFYKRDRQRKHRYIYITGGNKSLYSQVQYKELPYPKKSL